LASSIECSVNNGGRRVAIPVVSKRNDVLAAKVGSVESKIVGAERTVGVHDAAEVAGDTTVVANAVAGLASDIMAEVAHAGLELFKDDGLGLDLADLLRDNPLSHLLKDEETLLNDYNTLAVAYKLLVLLNDDLLPLGTTEVVGAVEVIEAIEGRDALPVVERDGGAWRDRRVSSGNQSPDLGQRLGHDTDNHGRSGEDGEKFGEHF